MDEDPGEAIEDSGPTINGDGDKQILAPSEGPREHLISTAMKFLQNPKVQTSPLYQKKAFLEKKGLTQEEINIAVERSGVKDVVSAGPPIQAPPAGYQPGAMNGTTNPPVPLYAQIPPQSGWAKMRDLTMTTVVVASVSYAVYQLFQKYLRPLLLGKSEQEKRMDRLEAQIFDIQKSVCESLSELNKTLAGLQTSIQISQQPQLPSFSHEKGMSELKAEVSSLKGLLLNRNQFPPAPAVPVLPAWQRAQQPSPPAPETTAVSSSVSLSEATATSLTSITEQAVIAKDDIDSQSDTQTLSALQSSETEVD